MSKERFDRSASDYNNVCSILARMREAMIEAHPELLTGSVSDVLECALCLEDYQKELQSKLERAVEALEKIAQWESRLPPLAEERIARETLSNLKEAVQK